MLTSLQCRIALCVGAIAGILGMISLPAAAVPELHPRVHSGVKAYSNMKERSGVEAYSNVEDFSGVEAFQNGVANSAAANAAAANAAAMQQASIDWPYDSISYSDMNQIFQKVPVSSGSSYNIQFPNSSNWDVTPEKARSLLSNYTQVSQAGGLTGRLPDLAFSSLGINKITSGMGMFSITSLDGAKAVMKMAVDQFRYAQLNLGDDWPDWMKRLFVALYDSMMMAIDFMFDTLSVVASGNVNALQGQMQTASDATDEIPQNDSTKGNGFFGNGIYNGR